MIDLLILILKKRKMDSLKQLEVWEKVNKCETLEELAKVILFLAGENGLIQGRTRLFNAKKMHDACINFVLLPNNVLTREFGIRQQAIMITSYE
tara:strand:+ start:1815 stop:2096 length:282 start_codon:yes stop_codon:yes gene_type:complete